MATIRQIVTKKGKGWQIDYYVSGIRRRKTVYCSKRNAQNIAKSLEWKKANIELGLETLVNNHIALGKVVIKYMALVEYQKKASTLKREKLVYNSLIKYIGSETAIGNITKNNIQNYLIKRQKQDNLKPDTIHIEIRILRLFFNFLINHGYLTHNPTKGIKGPKKNPVKINYLTIKEVNHLLDTIDDPDYRDLVTTYIYTGARKSEILAPLFKWNDVDFENRKIRITGKMDKVCTIPINDTVYDILYRRHKAGHEYPYQFDYHYMYKKIKKYLTKAGLPNATIHTFRKTFGSILVQNGVDIFRVSKLCRHSSVTVTQNHYAELLDDNLADSVKVLDTVFK